MGAWDTYARTANIRGVTKREVQLNRETHAIRERIPDNLSYQIVDLYGLENGYNIHKSTPTTQNVAIINSDNLNEKTIIAMPGEDIVDGSLVHWMDNYWLVSERDANTTVCTKAKMLQCNHLLKWVSVDDKIIEQWCIIEDGTKYLTGEFEDRNFIVTRGDSRISMTLARNAETVRLGRSNRFLIDDVDSPVQLAYALTKPLKLGWTYNNTGIFKFVLQEVQTTVDDNFELRLADYYKHFSKDATSTTQQSPQQEQASGSGEQNSNGANSGNGKKVWL